MTSHPKLDHEVVSLVFLMLLHRDRCKWVFGERWAKLIDERKKKSSCFVFEEITQSSSKKSSVSQKSPSMNVKPRRFFQVQKSLFSLILFRNLARDASARCLRSRSAILIHNEKQNLMIGVRIWRVEELCCKHYSDSYSERSSSRHRLGIICRNVFYFKASTFSQLNKFHAWKCFARWRFKQERKKLNRVTACLFQAFNSTLIKSEIFSYSFLAVYDFSRVPVRERVCASFKNKTSPRPSGVTFLAMKIRKLRQRKSFRPPQLSKQRQRKTADNDRLII